MSKMNNYLKEVGDALNYNSNWRYGQTLFNVLYEHHPDLADEIRGGELDPYYKEGRKGFEKFLHYVNCRLEECGGRCGGNCICEQVVENGEVEQE